MDAEEVRVFNLRPLSIELAVIRNFACQSLQVWITSTGQCYHRGGCRFAKQRSTLKQANGRGLRPCSICKPPVSKQYTDIGLSYPADGLKSEVRTFHMA